MGRRSPEFPLDIQSSAKERHRNRAWYYDSSNEGHGLRSVLSSLALARYVSMPFPVHCDLKVFRQLPTIGIAVRISQDIGLHVSSSQASSGSEDDVLRKTWTALGLLDVMLSLQLNRPTAVDFSVYGRRKTDLSRTGNDAHPTVDDAILQLCGYLSDVRKMYASNILDVSLLSEIRDGLQGWKRKIPSEFQLHYDEEQSPLVVTMHMIYHVAIVLLHRPL